MKRHSVRPLLMAATAIAALCPTALYAQTTPVSAAPPPSAAATPAGGDLSDIIVTARRTEERLQDVPISISVFSPQQLSNRNIVTASDLGTYTPALAANTRYGDEAASFSIRGFTQENGTSPSVAVYFADVAALRSAGGLPAGNGVGVGSFFDLQNVQVLKGPQGTLFGRNTTGGAILLVPQKPTDKFEGYVEGSLGNYGMKRVQGVVNIPLSDVARFRIGADWQKRDGYLHNESDLGPRDFDDINYYSIRASLVVDLTPNLETYFIGTYSNSDTHGPGSKVTVCNPTPGASPGGAFGCAQVARQEARGDGFYDIENNTPDARQYASQWRLQNTTTWTASDTLTLKNIVSYGEFRNIFNGSLFGENINLGGGIEFPFIEEHNWPGYLSQAQSTFTEELQLQGRSFNNRLTWQTGLYFENSKPLGYSATADPTLIPCTDIATRSCTDVLGAGVGFPIGSIAATKTTQTFRNLAAYAQGTFKLTDRLSITGGIRYTDDKSSGLALASLVSFPGVVPPGVEFCKANPAIIVVGENSSACADGSTAHSHAPTWLIDIDYKPTNDILIYAKYARGYRQGSVDPSLSGSFIFGPEKVDSYEGGVKTSFRGALHGTLNVAGFYDTLSNQQLQATVLPDPTTLNNPTATIINGGKSRMYGVEVDGSISPFKGLTVDVGYAYLNAVLKNYTGFPALPVGYIAFQPSALPGKPLTYSPKNRYTITGTYVLPLDPTVGKVSVAATFTHTDSQISTYASAFGLLDATNLLNLNANWAGVAGTPIDLSVFATNVTNKKYYTYTSGGYTSIGWENEGIGEPRMVGGRIKYHF